MVNEFTALIGNRGCSLRHPVPAKLLLVFVACAALLAASSAPAYQPRVQTSPISRTATASTIAPPLATSLSLRRYVGPAYWLTRILKGPSAPAPILTRSPVREENVLAVCTMGRLRRIRRHHLPARVPARSPADSPQRRSRETT